MTTSRATTMLKGLGALTALAAAIVAVPLLLETVAGNPIPDALPTWDQIGTALTSQDDGTLLLGLLKYAAWTGWALFTLSVVADVLTRLRGLPTPRLGPQQQLATRLVGAVLALTMSAPTALPAAAAPPIQTTGADTSVSAATTTRVAGHAAGHGQSAVDAEQQPFEEYRVRRGDCLWDIAWNELGEPERWPEIFEASRTVRQPDGRRLTDPDLIVTGWVLHVPAAPDEVEHTPDNSGDDQRTTSPPTDSGSSRPSSPGSVVTPFRRAPVHAGAATGHDPSSRHGESGGPVATALNTPTHVSGAQASALETRWHQAVRRHDVDAGLEGGWRGRVAGQSD